MDNSVERTHCLQYRYTFLHPLSNADVSQIVGVVANSDFDCSNLSYPAVAWQTGVIRLHGPITFGLQYIQEGEQCISLHDLTFDVIICGLYLSAR